MVTNDNKTIVYHQLFKISVLFISFNHRFETLDKLTTNMPLFKFLFGAIYYKVRRHAIAA